MRILGIDIGSRETKFAIMENEMIVHLESISTMKFYKEYCTQNEGIIFKDKFLNYKHFDIKISTGYGKNNNNLIDFTSINELKAHCFGALFQTSLKNFTLLDVGGQDVKVISVENGNIIDIELNEKCAASSGRFLENMAALLEININDLFLYHKEPFLLSSTCSVFAESEVIGKIAEGVALENIYAGINFSLYKKISPIFKKFDNNICVLTGGVAKNKAFISFLNNDFNKIVVPEEPQFNGAIGCCYYGKRSLI